jgi:hypothetical protein
LLETGVAWKVVALAIQGIGGLVPPLRINLDRSASGRDFLYLGSITKPSVRALALREEGYRVLGVDLTTIPG